MQRQSVGWVLAIALLVTVSGCDTNDNSGPDVSGTYTGRFDRDSEDYQLNGQIKAQVEQSGSQVTIVGTLTGFNITVWAPTVTGSLDDAGGFVQNSIGGGKWYNDHICGMVRVNGLTIDLNGNQMRWHMTAYNADCGDITINATLSRS